MIEFDCLAQLLESIASAWLDSWSCRAWNLGTMSKAGRHLNHVLNGLNAEQHHSMTTDIECREVSSSWMFYYHKRFNVLRSGPCISLREATSFRD